MKKSLIIILFLFGSFEFLFSQNNSFRVDCSMVAIYNTNLNDFNEWEEGNNTLCIHNNSLIFQCANVQIIVLKQFNYIETHDG